MYNLAVYIAGYHLISSEQSSLTQLAVSLRLLAAQLRLQVDEVREESRRLVAR